MELRCLKVLCFQHVKMRNASGGFVQDISTKTALPSMGIKGIFGRSRRPWLTMDDGDPVEVEGIRFWYCGMPLLSVIGTPDSLFECKYIPWIVHGALDCKLAPSDTILE
jgi:uncharacterized Fe-S cluster protein YjdI